METSTFYLLMRSNKKRQKQKFGTQRSKLCLLYCTIFPLIKVYNKKKKKKKCVKFSIVSTDASITTLIILNSSEMQRKL